MTIERDEVIMITRMLSKCPKCSKKKKVYINKPTKCYSCGNLYCTVAIEYVPRDYSFLDNKDYQNNNYKPSYANFELLGIDRLACSFYPYPAAYDTQVEVVDTENYGCEFVILTQKVKGKTINNIYLVYNCYYSDCSKTYYHGTPGYAEEIMKNGWKIPRTWEDKSHGLLGCERGLRYAGIDTGPALSHSGSDGDVRQIVNIKYDGWVLQTKLCVGGEKFRTLFEALRGVFGAIEYYEFGRAIIFSEKSKPRPAGWVRAADMEQT